MLLRPLAVGDEGELLHIRRTPGVLRWWDVPEEGFPWDEPESTRLTIEVGGVIAGLIQFSEEITPKYRHASIDLFLDPALHGRGLGSEAVSSVVRHLIDDCGHHRITIRQWRTQPPSGATRRSASNVSASCASTSVMSVAVADTTAC
jgi:aminoglycoside 6'-N-acetyltransferase